MDTKLKTLRITQFKGLNKTANPSNIDDAEFYDMVNMELSEDRSLQSRLGFKKVIDHIDSTVPAVKGMYKADWDNSTSTLYSARVWGLCKNDETTGYESFKSVLPNPQGKAVQFQRWHDKLLMLAQGETLMWMDSSEVLSDIGYPEFQLTESSVNTSTGGSLEESTTYQYNISVVCGDDHKEGESAGALPQPDEWYIVGTTSSPNKTLEVTATFSAKLNGFDIGCIKLFRRLVRTSGTTYIEDMPWGLVDTATIQKTNNTYELVSAVESVVTAVTGTYTPSNDSATLTISFTDNGEGKFNSAEAPLDAGYLTIPGAKYMARINNRVFLGNITGTSPLDRKTVRFTYIGRVQTMAGLVDEIPNFAYEYPMLAFGPFSWFYCDHEDTDDEITGMYGYRNSLMVFTGKCTFMWQEGMLEPVKISNDVGCIASETIREFEGRLIWLSTNGVVMYDGSKLKNLSSAKVNSYINNLSKDYSWKACAAIFNRRYYISAPFSGGVDNDTVLVYDFDLDEWTTSVYHIVSASTHFYIDCFYKYSDGAKETLYAAGHSTAATPLCYIVKLEEGYDDGGLSIAWSLKTKYYSFGAPDIIKNMRAFNIDISNRNATDITMDLYTDGLMTPAYQFYYVGATDGFLLNDPYHGRLNVDSIVTVNDEMFAFSLPIGKNASRVQFGINGSAIHERAMINAIGFDWRVVRKLQRKYGGA